MLKINEHMHKIWKSQMEQKSLQSSISGWVMNLPFDSKVKEWVAAEERYKQEVHMKNILLDVADKFLVNQADRRRGASILCFDEIQVNAVRIFFFYRNFLTKPSHSILLLNLRTRNGLGFANFKSSGAGFMNLSDTVDPKKMISNYLQLIQLQYYILPHLVF